MPTFVKERTVPLVTSRTYFYGDSSESINPVQVFSSRKEVPATVKRKKPKDLWAESTSRTVISSRKANTSPTVAKVKFNGDYHFIESLEYPIGDSSALSQNIGLRPSAFGGNFGIVDNKILGKVKDQKTNLTLAIAELGKTTDMVAGLARDIVGTFRGLRNGRTVRQLWRDISNPYDRASRKVASRWLEYTYGWRPTMMDVHGLSQEITTKINTGVYLYVTAQHTENLQFGSPHESDEYHLYSDSITQKAKARFQVDNTNTKQLVQFGITNPAVLAWELVPYSFVVDWALNVGDYLQLLDASVGTSGFSIIRSSRFRRTVSQVSGKGIYTSTRGSSVMSETITYRGEPAGVPSPTYLGYKPSLNTTRMISAISLLRMLHK